MRGNCIYNLYVYLPSFLNIFSIIFFHLIHVREQFTMSIKLDLDNSMKITSRISVGNVSIVCMDQNWITEYNTLLLLAHAKTYKEFFMPFDDYRKSLFCFLIKCWRAHFFKWLIFYHLIKKKKYYQYHFSFNSPYLIVL